MWCMPEEGGYGASSSKRPRLASEDRMDVEAVGRTHCTHNGRLGLKLAPQSPQRSLTPKAKAAEALGYTPVLQAHPRASSQA